MASVTEALRALMEADRWIERVRAQRTHLPEMSELGEVEEQLRVLARGLSSAQHSLAPVRSAYEHAAQEAQRLRQRAHDLGTTLAASTANARELSVLQHEVEHVRELLDRAEDVELELLIALEPLDEAVASIKSQAQPLVLRRSELQGIIRDLQATLDDELVALNESRAQRASAVEGEVRVRYDHALARTGGSGAALVDGARCDGCRIALSPLDVDRWKAQPGETFMDCPECGRLLLP